MQSFIYNGKTIDFSIKKGTVAGATKWSETRISSSGGGGSVKDGSGYVAAPTISSTVLSHLEFFLIDENGKEFPVNLGSINIPLRDGQKVTIMSGRLQSSNKACMTVLINHNSQEWHYLLTSDQLIDYFGLAGSWSYQPYIAVLIAVVVTFSLLCAFLAMDAQDLGLSFILFAGIPFMAGMVTSFSYGFATYQSGKEKRNSAKVSIKGYIEGLVKELSK